MSQPTSQPARHDDAPPITQCRAALFDLDGTLADTAPDLVAAVNKMRLDRGLELAPIDRLRPLASAGARGLIGGAFGIGPDDRDYAPMREEFLANYEADLCIETTLFPGIAQMLDALDARGIRWGIVTNKVGRLTMPLVEQLGLASRAGCVVSGDTTPHSKPHPAPLLYAAEALALAPGEIVYVGDDLRDIQAGFAAGMATVAAAYGYCGTDLPPAMWHAQHIVDTPQQLAQLLGGLI
ncbi:phosphoglycolate phosphatase [Trinickia dinghuensis]|uniref:phosphoglycolate phosphatase n=1 Tax=Trinickia dinghuensis TaxID=2291023 RepID=A0A3D8JW29_9BURK|nr:phosphoglycolate phosphatase [Trinickia dinghuensis]RDU97070.1 phosphoglycolate phosphatase [Trinickia dinghuensis]